MANDLTPIRFPKSLKKSFNKKPASMQAAIVSCLRQLRENPRHPGLGNKKMQGTVGIFEAKVDRKNRVTWYWDGDCIVIENHCNHSIVGK